MDKSNEILFNESALHSLKRAQLVALCKRYDIKQSGKNEDLVARLQFYAHSLLNKQKQTTNATIADYITPLNDVEGNHDSHENARTSQQWEIVEEGPEEDVIMSNSRSRTISMRSAMSISTLKSIGSGKDFAMGSVSSKGSGSVSSSLMSIASSLKRAGSKSSKSSKMSSSSSGTTSTTDSIVKQPMAHLFPPVPPNIPTTEKPVPEIVVDGAVVESEAPNSDDATEESLIRPITQGVIDGSKLQKEQSTIRLVTPAAARLRVNAPNATLFATPNLKPFNLVVTDPKEDIGNAFLAMDDGKSDIGNAFLAMDARSFTETTKSEEDASNTSTFISDITQALPQEEEAVTPKKGGLLTVSPSIFVFGSPANAVSNAEFGNAAAAVLEEMNKRLGLGSDAPGAVKLGVDGTIDFGELTPSGKSTLNLGGKKGDEGRFGRAHEKVFGQMTSIADHYAVKRPPPMKMSGTLAGTKRKSTAAFDEYNHASHAHATGKRIICLDDPKDKPAAPPPPKRQRVDGVGLAKIEKASVATATTIKDDEAALKKVARGRRSSKGRMSMGGSAARRRSVAPVKVPAPSGRFGLLRSGAAKVMKTILSTVSHPTPSTSKAAPVNERPLRASAAGRANATPSEDPSSVKLAVALKAKISVAPVPARPSTLAPRASAAPRKASQATTSSTSTRASLAPKVSAAANASVVKAPKAPLQRGGLPVFEAPAPPAKDALTSGLAAKRVPSGSVVVTKRTSVTSRASVATSAAGSRRPSAVKPIATKVAPATSLTPATDSQNRRVSRSGTAASKATLDSVQEAPATKTSVDRNPDFEPASISSATGVSESVDYDGSRPPSPLPAPPASLSSRPLQRRQPLEPLQPDVATDEGSIGRRPRISRSKVIAKVHANRLRQGAAGSAGIASATLTGAVKAKGRKSGGVAMSAKAKLMGGEGARGRASVTAAEAAKRKARMSGVAAAGTRRRTMAQAVQM